MKYKYLYEKDWKDGNITRKLFKNEDDLLNYMLENKITLFKFWIVRLKKNIINIVS